MSGSAPNSYLRDAVMTASPEQLHLMLYDGAIRFALQARDAMIAENWEASYNKFSRAQAIILEMQSGLRHEINPELCDRMASIYTFLYRKLVEASVNRDPAAVDDAVKILRYQRETWVMLMDKLAELRRSDDSDASAESALDQEVPPSTNTLSIEG